jgi:hypothetical protein
MLERQRRDLVKAKAEGKPAAHPKADDAVRLFEDAKKVAHGT